MKRIALLLIIASTMFAAPLKLATFDRPAHAATTLQRLVKALYGRGAK